MPRVRKIDCSQPGIVRRRRGRGFEYLDPDGTPVRDGETLARIAALAIPPAWKDVWIAPIENGHLQAVGTDAAGRRQYLYHERWRAHRDREKYERMVEFARGLPQLREQCARDLDLPGMPHDRVLACAVRMLDRGFFRVGSDQYVEENGTYGIATLLKEHTTISDGMVVFDYPAKGSIQRVQCIADPQVVEVIGVLKRRHGGLPQLLAYREGRVWVDVGADDINAYIKQHAGEAFTAKDFRTWHATVLAAMALAIADQQRRDAGKAGKALSTSAHRRTITKAVKEVAHYLGNTPAVCRSSYIDPRVFDRYVSGSTVAGALEKLQGLSDFEHAETQQALEAAVISLLEGRDVRVITRTATQVLNAIPA